jgi:hypothetical protein
MCLGVSVDDERQVVARVQVGLEGEALHLYSANGAHTVNWTSSPLFGIRFEISYNATIRSTYQLQSDSKDNFIKALKQ